MGFPECIDCNLEGSESEAFCREQKKAGDYRRLPDLHFHPWFSGGRRGRNTLVLSLLSCSWIYLAMCRQCLSQLLYPPCVCVWVTACVHRAADFSLAAGFSYSLMRSRCSHFSTHGLSFPLLAVETGGGWMGWVGGQSVMHAYTCCCDFSIHRQQAAFHSHSGRWNWWGIDGVWGVGRGVSHWCVHTLLSFLNPRPADFHSHCGRCCTFSAHSLKFPSHAGYWWLTPLIRSLVRMPRAVVCYGNGID